MEPVVRKFNGRAEPECSQGSKERSNVIFGVVGDVEGEEVIWEMRSESGRGKGGFATGFSLKVPAGKQERDAATVDKGFVRKLMRRDWSTG